MCLNILLWSLCIGTNVLACAFSCIAMSVCLHGTWCQTKLHGLFVTIHAVTVSFTLSIPLRKKSKGVVCLELSTKGCWKLCSPVKLYSVLHWTACYNQDNITDDTAFSLQLSAKIWPMHSQKWAGGWLYQAHFCLSLLLSSQHRSLFLELALLLQMSWWKNETKAEFWTEYRNIHKELFALKHYFSVEFAVLQAFHIIHWESEKMKL